jgi:hypothetical protein
MVESINRSQGSRQVINYLMVTGAFDRCYTDHIGMLFSNRTL